MREVNIHSGWFRTAGIKYGWERDGHHPYGVGLKMEELEKKHNFIVYIDGRKFYLEGNVALDFVNKYKCTYLAGNTRLGLVSRSVLREIGGAGVKDPVPTKEEIAKAEESPQKPLL